jgi:hypothetical protein
MTCSTQPLALSYPTASLLLGVCVCVVESTTEVLEAKRPDLHYCTITRRAWLRSTHWRQVHGSAGAQNSQPPWILALIYLKSWNKVQIMVYTWEH